MKISCHWLWAWCFSFEGIKDIFKAELATNGGLLDSTKIASNSVNASTALSKVINVSS